MAWTKALIKDEIGPRRLAKDTAKVLSAYKIYR